MLTQIPGNNHHLCYLNIKYIGHNQQDINTNQYTNMKYNSNTIYNNEQIIKLKVRYEYFLTKEIAI